MSGERLPRVSFSVSRLSGLLLGMIWSLSEKLEIALAFLTSEN